MIIFDLILLLLAVQILILQRTIGKMAKHINLLMRLVTDKMMLELLKDKDFRKFVKKGCKHGK